jgi:hypothetical protein
MALPKWSPTNDELPSATRRGETTTAPIYAAVGDALSSWEHLESGLTRLFQLLCETASFAACRAYGTVDSPFNRSQMLRAAMEVFFASREAIGSKEHKDMKELLNMYEQAQLYRNNIAHGIAVGFFLKAGGHSGYFLCPPSSATKKVAKIDPKEVYLYGARYWYDSKNINHYRDRFAALLRETMELIQSVNSKYKILKPEQLHP